MSSSAKTTSRTIYGITSTPKPCLYTIPKTLDINIYLRQLNMTMIALKNNNNKVAALENIQIVQNNIAAAIAGAGASPVS